MNIAISFIINYMIGNRIKLARRERGKSQEWLAEEVGVRQTSVSAWERGSADPTVDNMSRVSQVLNVNFEWLAKGVGAMTVGGGSALNEQPSAYDMQTEEQRELLALFDQLSKKKREVLMTFVKDWIEK